jgi:hypothetical protein
MTDEQRTIGRLEAHVEQLRAQVAEQDKKLDAIIALVEQGKGARWALTALASISGVIGGFLFNAFTTSRGG